MKKPVLGDVYAAQFTLDNEWYRAMVMEIKGDNCSVQYIDYGNREVIPVTSLRKLENHMTKLPIMVSLKPSNF